MIFTTLPFIKKSEARKGGFRHLIYFIDGTWLWPGSDSALDGYSNVYLMNTLLNADDENGNAQIVHYVRGLGAVDGIRRYTSGGFSYGIDELIADLYINICSNYQRDDKIYIFGFSRGAVIARALSGLLSKGILDAKNINQLTNVWRDYISSGEIKVPGIPKHDKEIADYREFCSENNPIVEFLGVFDTVSGGHGLSDVAQKLRLSHGNVQHNVKNAVHILSLDESRSFFRPVLWTNRKNEVFTQGTTQTEHFEQIWMPGVHADIGGGYTDRFLGNLSLITMIDRVIAKTNLSFDVEECKKYNIPITGGARVRINDDKNGYWKYINPVRYTRNIDSNIKQSIHPYANYLINKAISYKSHKSAIAYRPYNKIDQMDEAEELISGKFQTIIPK